MPPTGPQSVDRALAILDAVADAAGPVSAKALARRTGCSLSTAYHLLAPLTARGYLVRTAQGFGLGPRIPGLHRSLLRQLEPAPRMADLLARLRRATGAEAYHTAYRGGLITVVDTTAPVTDAANPFTPGGRPGRTPPRTARRCSPSCPGRCGGGTWPSTEWPA